MPRSNWKVITVSPKVYKKIQELRDKYSLSISELLLTSLELFDTAYEKIQRVTKAATSSS